MYPTRIDQDFITSQLVSEEHKRAWDISHTDAYRQLSLFDDGFLGRVGMSAGDF